MFTAFVKLAVGVWFSASKFTLGDSEFKDEDFVYALQVGTGQIENTNPLAIT